MLQLLSFWTPKAVQDLTVSRVCYNTYIHHNQALLMHAKQIHSSVPSGATEGVRHHSPGFPEGNECTQ